MNEQILTRHAAVRSQQRAIPQLIIDWLFAYGASVADRQDAEILYFDHAARRRLGRAVGDRVVSLLGSLLDSYVVVGATGKVITVGHRYKRLTRH